MNKQSIYLMLTVIGFLAPNVLVAIESFETGNLLLYADPVATFSDMFANRISTIFAIDLFAMVFIFFVWSYLDQREHRTKGWGWTWPVTMLLGLSTGFPLYLYLRERQKAAQSK